MVEPWTLGTLGSANWC